MKASAIKYDEKNAKTAPPAVVDALGAAGERRVKDTEPPQPDPDRGPPLLSLLGDLVLNGGVDDDIF